MCDYSWCMTCPRWFPVAFIPSNGRPKYIKVELNDGSPFFGLIMLNMQIFQMSEKICFKEIPSSFFVCLLGHSEGIFRNLGSKHFKLTWEWIFRVRNMCRKKMCRYPLMDLLMSFHRFVFIYRLFECQNWIIICVGAQSAYKCHSHTHMCSISKIL